MIRVIPSGSERLASMALGTGDIDCVYHFAIYELQAALKELGPNDASDLLSVMVEGKRLKDISDLPLDLATSGFFGPLILQQPILSKARKTWL